MNAILDSLNISSGDENIITEDNLNDNLRLNRDFLHRLREGSKHGGKQRLVVALNRKQRRAYGRLRDEEIQVIDIRQVHPTCKALLNQETGAVDFPNGLQIRKDDTTDLHTITKFEDLLISGQWEVTRDQMIVIVLPECYQYIDPTTGIKVIYGVLDGNHRYQSIDRLGEEVLFAWVVEFDDLIDIYEFGNAFCNRESNVVNERTHDDVAHSLSCSAIHPGHPLNERLEQTRLEGYTGPTVDEILEDYLRKIYDYTRKNQIDAVIMRFNQEENHQFHSSFKRYDSEQVDNMIQMCRPDWKPMPGVSSATKIMTNTKETIAAFPWIYRGSEVTNLIKKMAQAWKQSPDKTLISCYAPLASDASNYTENTVHHLDEKVKREVFDSLREITEFGNAFFHSDEGVNVRFSRLPVYGPEQERKDLIQH